LATKRKKPEVWGEKSTASKRFRELHAQTTIDQKGRNVSTCIEKEGKKQRGFWRTQGREKGVLDHNLGDSW